jgi:outer membrane protein
MNNKHIITLLFCLPVLVPVLSFSQTQEGSILARGAFTINFNSVKQEVDNSTRKLGSLTTLEFNPSAGFFIIDGVAVGIAMDWQRQSAKDSDNKRNVEHSLTLGPFGRFYTELGPFFQAQFSFGGGSEKERPEGGPEVVSRFGIFSWGIGLGYPYFLNDKISLEPLLLYRAQNRSREIAGGSDEITKYRGLMIQLGLVYYIFDK